MCPVRSVRLWNSLFPKPLFSFNIIKRELPPGIFEHPCHKNQCFRMSKIANSFFRPPNSSEFLQNSSRIPPEFLPNSCRIPPEFLSNACRVLQQPKPYSFCILEYAVGRTLQFCILEYAAGREGHVAERPRLSLRRGFSSCRTPEAFSQYSHGTDEFQVGFDMV